MPTIVYVDDSRDDLFYLDYIRRKQQIDVDLFCFSTAETALEALKQRVAEGWAPPELLVADLYMPLDSGIGLVSSLRGDDRFSAMRLAICSGSDAAEDRARALEAGADFYLEKPLDLAAILLNLEV
ncbi:MULTISPECIES: response regulator [Rhizobium]|uniref:Response regulator n=2 Tax=Rhizobium TaxID=379 RepID=A0A192T5W6_9HYPH|nr:MULTISPECIES: response regulator [Rhizobium]ACE89692.1 putative two-component response regulator protein [Rhizobium etli CIAT 652]KEC72540.1 two-component response regulator protein [Rhizobium leguminosarum bv. phaseoli CCGM1]MDH6647694.1 DNA-binding response OmpR family regulator [Rhizobium esperanzae]ANL39108.1 response regulator CheY-like domain-containing protein [Rhizobium phaseoli]ANL45409.1 response regulator CheY-like domain-containing protein [Rhizobium phaseoli]